MGQLSPLYQLGGLGSAENLMPKLVRRSV